MNRLNERAAKLWTHVGVRFLPFADVADADLPFTRLIRLALFQVSVGMATVLLIGTLNRVMIVELNVSSTLVALMVALPVLFAPLRTLVGFRSDHHRSAFGWKRVPYLWFGTMMQFGGLAIMPFALLVMSGGGQAPAWVGQIGAALAFLLVGAGMQTTQTAGLALATDLATPANRPRVVALMYVMLLAGMVVSGFVFSELLETFTATKLVQVVQGAAVATVVLNIVALWKQEARAPRQAADAPARPAFRETWRAFMRTRNARRFLVTVGLGTAAFNMQDIVLEPYGGEVLNLPVGATTLLTALVAGGALVAFATAARKLAKGTDPHRLAAVGALVGLAAFSAVIFAAPMQSPTMFRIGALLIGFGGGLFAVGTLIAAMDMDFAGHTGLALGAWGAVQATAAGASIAFGGALRDGVGLLASQGSLGETLQSPATGYGAVYYLELMLLFVTLVAIGPLVRRTRGPAARPAPTFGLAEFPG